MQFNVNFQINGEPATWEELLQRVTRMAKAAKAASAGVADMGAATERMANEFRAANADIKRRRVDDFIRWLAKHQDDGMVTT